MRKQINVNCVDTVSADEKDDEVEADDGTERRHSAVSVDAVVHDKVPVFTRQYLHRQSVDTQQQAAIEQPRFLEKNRF